MSMPKPATLADVLSHIDRDALHDQVLSWHDQGMDADQIIHEITRVIDAAVPWGALGPVGLLIEMVDGPIAEAIARLIVHAIIAAKKHPS